MSKPYRCKHYVPGRPRCREPRVGPEYCAEHEPLHMIRRALDGFPPPGGLMAVSADLVRRPDPEFARQLEQAMRPPTITLPDLRPAQQAMLSLARAYREAGEVMGRALRGERR